MKQYLQYLQVEATSFEMIERGHHLYKDSPKYEKLYNHPECLVCGCELRIIWECACGENEGVIDEDNPELPVK